MVIQSLSGNMWKGMRTLGYSCNPTEVGSEDHQWDVSQMCPSCSWGEVWGDLLVLNEEWCWTSHKGVSSGMVYGLSASHSDISFVLIRAPKVCSRQEVWFVKLISVTNTDDSNRSSVSRCASKPSHMYRNKTLKSETCSHLSMLLTTPVSICNEKSLL